MRKCNHRYSFIFELILFLVVYGMFLAWLGFGFRSLDTTRKFTVFFLLDLDSVVVVFPWVGWGDRGVEACFMVVQIEAFPVPYTAT